MKTTNISKIDPFMEEDWDEVPVKIRKWKIHIKNLSIMFLMSIVVPLFVVFSIINPNINDKTLKKLSIVHVPLFISLSVFFSVMIGTPWVSSLLIIICTLCTFLNLMTFLLWDAI